MSGQNRRYPIASDRPGQAITPYLVPTKLLQLQSGITFRRLDYTNANQDDEVVEAIVRYGLSKKLELGIALNYLNTSFNSSIFESTNSGVNSTSIQARYNLFSGDNFFEIISIQFSIGIPVINNDFQQKHLYPRITLINTKRINRYISLTSNLGVNWTGFQTNPNGFYVINLSYALSTTVGVFVEQYSTFNESDIEPKIDGGFSYLVNNDFQLDISGGYYTEDPAIDSDFFISAGVSWRVKVN